MSSSPPSPRLTQNRPGLFTLLEIMPVISVIAVLILIALTALRPMSNFETARNRVRLADLAHVGDGLAEYGRDENRAIFLLVPLSPSSIEICGDVRTGSCLHLLDLSPLLGAYIDEIPLDPKVTDPGSPHSRYFIQMTASDHFRLFAPDTEPSGVDPLEVIR
ncbi:MAG TPA: type II secretion system protein [Candidatus Peribacterales bacterium]|nr:type II secretion system protein [Candidatus Peribacterales bacterium]